MKNPILKTLFLSALAISFCGCDLFDKADDVTLEEELVLYWNVDENLSGSNVPYSDFQILDLADYPEFEEYVDKIKSVEITKITYRITNFDNSPHESPVTLTNGVAEFGPFDSTTAGVSATLASASGVNLETVVNETTLTIDAAGLNKIAKDLLDDKKIKMYSKGTLSKTPVAYTVVSTFYVKVVANALD
jgi:hypothetical protein